MIRHIVMWKLAATDEESRVKAIGEITEALEGLVGVIPELIDLKVSRNVALPEKNFDAGLVSHVASVADLEAYLVDPRHVAAAEVVRARTTDRAAIDFEVERS